MSKSEPDAREVLRRFNSAIDPYFGERTNIKAVLGGESVAVIELYEVERLTERGSYRFVVCGRTAPRDGDLTGHKTWASAGRPVWFDDHTEAEIHYDRITHAPDCVLAFPPRRR